MKAIEIIEIELDKPRRLILTHGALRTAESAINRARGSTPEGWLPIERIINAAIRNQIFPADLTELLLWAGLSQDDPRLSVADVSKLITDRIYVNGKLMEACAAYWPKPNDIADDAPADESERPTTRPNGSTVGPSPGSKLN